MGGFGAIFILVVALGMAPYLIAASRKAGILGGRGTAVQRRARYTEPTGRVVEDEYLVDGKPLACTVCQHTVFSQREAQLNTALATAFKWDWANESALCVVCNNCGYVHWFVARK